MILVTSTLTTFTATQGIIKGLQYRFRYRVQNINGWSTYSDISYFYAFSAPERPPAPIFVSGTNTTVTL